jgi:hypothetical protein
MSIRATPPPGAGNPIYFRKLKDLAVRGADSNQQVIVYIRNRVIAIFPNKEVEVNTMNPGDHLVVREVGSPTAATGRRSLRPGGPWLSNAKNDASQRQRVQAPYPDGLRPPLFAPMGPPPTWAIAIDAAAKPHCKKIFRLWAAAFAMGWHLLA